MATTCAEQLIEVADEVLCVRDMLFVVGEPLPDNAMELVVLAIHLRRRPDVALRALVENWDRLRIVRELY